MSNAESPPGESRGFALHWQILIGVLVGGAVGLTANALTLQDDGKAHADLKWAADNVARPIGQVFLRLIFMVVIPLVFSALALGVASIGDVGKLGRMGVRTLFFTLILATGSVIIGLTLANVIRPGVMDPEKSERLRKDFAGGAETVTENMKKAKSLGDALLDIIPKNPLKEAVEAFDPPNWKDASGKEVQPGGGMLAVMFFALMFGVAIILSPERTGPLVGVLEGLYDVSMVIIGLAMRIAPVGVAALVFSLTAVLGLDIVVSLAWYVATVILGLGLHMFGVYSIVLIVFARMSPKTFFARTSEALFTAFGTASSNATLPTALRVGEQELKLKPEVSRFVLTVGSTANQNGTALYEGITVLFLAQVFGHTLSIDQQIYVVLMSILAGVGTAGVPGGSLPLIAMVLAQVGVRPEGIAIILGVDRLLDMCRTTVNVIGDLVVAACVDRAERMAEAARSN